MVSGGRGRGTGARTISRLFNKGVAILKDEEAWWLISPPSNCAIVYKSGSWILSKLVTLDIKAMAGHFVPATGIVLMTNYCWTKRKIGGEWTDQNGVGWAWKPKDA